MNPKNPNVPPGGFTDQDILKMFLFLKQEEMKGKKPAPSKRKTLSVEEYARQAVNNLLDKVGIDYDDDSEEGE
jgi:hypothetical protein